MDEHSGQAAAKHERSRRPRRTWLRLVLAVVLGLTLLECSVRFLLFSDSALAERLGARFRGAWRYATADTDARWNLKARFDPRPVPADLAFDPVVGWRNWAIAADYSHIDEPSLRGRTPVLLYGDSFARCATGSDKCFSDLVAESDRGETHRLLNFGVGGYGLDQTYLLLRASIDRFAERNPEVVVGILVDDDLDRSLLSFREWPKPRFEVDGDEMVLLQPPTHDVGEWLETHPVGIRSYAWRRLVVGSDVLPAGLRSFLTDEQGRWEELRVVNRAILGALRDELERRDLSYFVLLFHGHASVSAAVPSWKDEFLTETLAKLGMPYVLSRKELQDDALASGRDARDYFTWGGPGNAHYNTLGNEVVFRAMERGLDGDFDGP